MKLPKPILVWDELARRHQLLNVFQSFSIAMEQRVLIKYLREDGHGSTQIHSKLIEQYGDKALSYPILMSAIGCDSFARSEKGLKIRGATKNPQISRLISESRDRSKHRPVPQYEKLLRLPALLRQRYSMSLLKFLIWNFEMSKSLANQVLWSRELDRLHLKMDRDWKKSGNHFISFPRENRSPFLEMLKSSITYVLLAILTCQLHLKRLHSRMSHNSRESRNHASWIVY
jgi:hypothetical protein